MDRSPTSRRRRQVLQGAGAATALATLGFPAIVRSQSEAIRFGHLTPRTGFLGPLGEYAVMGVTLAVDEINAAGGVMGRKIELIAEDSVNPQTASTKAERLLERDKVAVIIGEISSASDGDRAGAQRNHAVLQHRLHRRTPGQVVQPLHVPAGANSCTEREGQALLRDSIVKGKVVQPDRRLRSTRPPSQPAFMNANARPSPPTSWCRRCGGFLAVSAQNRNAAGPCIEPGRRADHQP
jgi:hypothetical protein